MHLPDAPLWEMRNASRARLVDYINRRVGDPNLFSPQTLTLGFARRFVAYKRPDLLLQDPDRLVRLLTNSQQPVQLVIAGKAPPSDQSGRDLIRRWIQFIRDRNMSKHVLFLDDYDMLLAEHLVEGVDVWLNTPRRPWEASGTSGMKVLVNGGLNLSELDGWWAEAYTPEVGWALGDGQEHGDDPAWDAQEAQTLYKILEEEVIPSFYARNEEHIPAAWTAKMRHSMATLTPYFSANRTVRQYTEAYYITGASAYHRRTQNGSALGKDIVRWKHAIDQNWDHLQLGELHTDHQPGQENGQYTIDVPVTLSGIDPSALLVELYADGIDKGPAVHIEMTLSEHPSSGDAPAHYTAQVPAGRPAGDYTVRVTGRHADAAVPLENKRILWHR